jgi:predicted AAA+ superfamily ATPase
MDRYLMQDLIRWKDNPRRMPLIIRGPRQVGKSYLIEEFGKRFFKQHITLNFELNPHLKECFIDLDPVQVLNQIELTLGVHIVDEPSTLLVFDEIQECPQAILALRYFKEKRGDIPVIAAGSLLEFALNTAEFRMPVGRIQYLHLRPLSFEEFLIARGFSQLVSFLHTVTLENVPSDAVHQRLQERVREYLVLGGMPAVVSEFLMAHRFQPCQALQEGLLLTFRNDFGKYARFSQHHYLQAFFERAPGLVGEEFNFSKIDPNLRARELRPAMDSLLMAGLIHLIYRTRNDQRFKLHFIDVGLMVKASRLSAELILKDDFFALNRGAIMEQFVGQELLAYTPAEESGALYYWSREKKGSSAEVDFIVAVDDQVIPIEVKAGSTGRLKSMQVFLAEKNYSLGVKISMDPLSIKNNVLCVPAYMIQSLPRLVKSTLKFSDNQDFSSFESHRADLMPPKDDPLA